MDFPDYFEFGPAPCTSDTISPEIWFPEPDVPGQMEKIKFAREFCAKCPYQARCLEWGIEADEPGLWGGASRNERKRIKRDRIDHGRAGVPVIITSSYH